MKKKTKKLVLAKETVRSLSAVDLREAAGGTSGYFTYHLCTTDGGGSCRYCVDQPITEGC